MGVPNRSFQTWLPNGCCQRIWRQIRSTNRPSRQGSRHRDTYMYVSNSYLHVSLHTSLVASLTHASFLKVHSKRCKDLVEGLWTIATTLIDVTLAALWLIGYIICYTLCTYVMWCNRLQSAGSFDDMQDVHTGHKTDKGVVRKYT